MVCALRFGAKWPWAVDSSQLNRGRLIARRDILVDDRGLGPALLCFDCVGGHLSMMRLFIVRGVKDL